MTSLKNRAGVSTTTQGAGVIDLGPALPAGTAPYAASWQNFTDAGVGNGEIIRYLILDGIGRWEYGPGQYDAVNNRLTRPSGTMSGTIPGQRSSTGALLALTGTSQVFITAVAEDIQPLVAPGTVTSISGGTGITVTPSPIVGAGAVALAAIANNTALGNVSGGAAAPVALTVTQLTTLINTFTSTLKGAVPPSGGGTVDFLRADGTWIEPGARAQLSVTASPINVGATEQIVLCNISSGSPVANLPGYSTRAGLPVTFKDVGGQFLAHPLTVTPLGVETIEGQANWILANNFAGATFWPYNDGVHTGWFVL